MNSLLLEFIGKQPLFKIINFLIENKGDEHNKKDIIEGTGLCRNLVHNNWKVLHDNKIIRVTRQFGKTKLFVLDTKREIVKQLLELEHILISRELTRVDNTHQKNIATIITKRIKQPNRNKFLANIYIKGKGAYYWNKRKPGYYNKKKEKLTSYDLKEISFASCR